MENEKIVLDRIYNQMLARVKPSARRFSFITLRPTADWAGSKSIQSHAPSIKLKPGIVFRLLTIIIFGGAFVLLIKEMIVNPGEKLGLMIFLAILFGSIFFLTLYQFFFNKKLNYAIQIDADGITMGTDRYAWKNIGATGILTKGFGKSKTCYLVIVLLDNDKYQSYTLRLFVTIVPGGFAHKLSKWVEYFKPKTM